MLILTLLVYMYACHACEPVTYALNLIKRLQHTTTEVSHMHQAKSSSQLTTKLDTACQQAKVTKRQHQSQLGSSVQGTAPRPYMCHMKHMDRDGMCRNLLKVIGISCMRGYAPCSTKIDVLIALSAC